MNAQTIARGLGGASKGANGWWNARCPAHEDRKASLGLHDTDDGSLAYKCMAGCDKVAVGDALRARGLLNGRANGEDREARSAGRKPILDRRYDYFDAVGELMFQVERYANPKGFKQRRPDPNRPGGWISNLEGIGLRPLYRLRELLATSPAEAVYLVEGEKDADRMAAVGFIATTSSQGAKSWDKSDASPLYGRHVVIVPDNDPAGIQYLQEIARSLQGKAASVRLLELPNLPHKGDVSDWLDAGGTVDELRQLTDRAPPETGWLDPEELREGDEPQPFPLAALPPSVAAAVVEYQACGGQPVEMVVTAALAAMSGSVQGLVDVRRDSQLVGPVSLNTVVIADSGERKTTCDNAFSAAAERWARSEQKRIAPLYMDAKEKRDAHQAEKQGLISALRDASAKGKRGKGAAKDDAAADIDTLKNQLREHGRRLQPLPPQPTPRIENGTKEGVENVLRSAWPSIAWASSEGANVTGGHGFKDEALLRTLAFLNSRWDGAPIDRARSAEDYSKIYGRRVSVSLMLQPAAFEAFTRAGAGLARGIGNLARMLLVWPRSTMGTRFRDEDAADPELPALAAFLERAEALYRTPLSMPFDMKCMEFGADHEGGPAPDQLELDPLELALSAEARRLWIRYQNDCEAQLPAEGELADVRDVAAKSAENACRIAALFHVWEHGPTGSINSMDMERGVAVARWFLYEARRILCGSADHEAAAGDAMTLARWVESRPEPPTLQDVLQFGPYRLRKKAARDAAIALLTERYWLQQENRSGKTVLVLNPQLSWED